MIDIQNAKNEFMKYVEKIENNNSRHERKIQHSFRVMENCKRIATELNLTEEHINLAQLIGLLHDIGRFSEYKISTANGIKIDNGTLEKNKKFDHGEEGVEILKDNNYIRNYIQNGQYDDIIFTAIYEHNKYELNKNLDNEKELFCKIIKDADKIDIMFEAIYIYWQEKEQISDIEKGIISKKMLEDFYLEKLSNNKNSICELDQIIKICSFIYDINFKSSFKIIKENDYIDKIIDRFNYKVLETKEEMQKVKNIAKKYIFEKTK